MKRGAGWELVCEKRTSSLPNNNLTSHANSLCAGYFYILSTSAIYFAEGGRYIPVGSSL